MRPNRLSRLRRIAVITVVALTWLAPGAFAYWSNAGEGSAEANLATLSAPAITSATTGAETVTLSWSAVTPPGEGTVEYYVTRDGSTASAGCPSSSLALDGHELHRHQRPGRRPQIQGHSGVALVDVHRRRTDGDGCLRPGYPPRARSREHHARSRRSRQPHDHRQGRDGRHGRHLFGFAQPDLRRRQRSGRRRTGRPRQLRRRTELRRRNRNHLHRRQGHGVERDERGDEALQDRSGAHQGQGRLAQQRRRTGGDGQSSRGQEVQHADALRTGSGHLLQRYPHRH